MSDDAKRDVKSAAIDVVSAGADAVLPGLGTGMKVTAKLLPHLRQMLGKGKALAAIQREEFEHLQMEARWEEHREFAARAFPELLSRLEGWYGDAEQGQDDPETSDLYRLAGRVEELFKDADRKKREILHHAFINAFDPSLYKTGMVDGLMEKLKDPDFGYPAVHLLKTMQSMRKRQMEPDASDPDEYYIKVLERLGLVQVTRHDHAGDRGRWVTVTHHGEVMKRLLAEPPGS